MPKPFTWSFSKLKNFETCAKKYYEVDVAKNYSDSGEQMIWGTRVHADLAKAVSEGVPLPTDIASYKPWIERVLKLHPGAKLLVEQKYAITKDFSPTTYFAPNVWYRGIGDWVAIGEWLGIILDWKTGAVKHDSTQLMLMAQCVFSHFPNIKVVKAGFVWLGEDTHTLETFTRESLAEEWPAVLARVANMEHAHKTLTFPPKPSGLCRKHCPVTSCPHHGKGAF